MRFFALFFGGLFALTVGFADALSPAYAGVNCTSKTTEVNGKFGGSAFGAPADTRSLGIGDDDNFARLQAEDCSGTKDLNGRVGQAAALGAALDSRIANPGERINLDLNWMTNDIGGAGAVGGSAFFNIPELDEHLYIGVRGGFGFEGQGALVGLGVSYAFSPF